MTENPIDLTAALAAVDELWSPRIVASVNDYDVRIAKIEGEYIWHEHSDTDEFFLVLDGTLHIALRDGDGGAQRSVVLDRGSVFVVPAGTEHRPSSPGGASILMFEPNGTPNVGDHHDPLPDHITVFTGREG
ncbi:cupin domain-containing protein [Actinoplanes sp. NPDC051851]|uniref:cupin domain-containing protein n=1 Tax=Actinoplanes sp. NPDC051851 TaxID=3154753 RepID=UPI003436947C